MNDIFKSKLEILASDELMIASIRCLLDERIEKEKPKIGETDNNAVLGEKFRAYEQAQEMITKAFIDLKIYERAKKTDKTFNKER